MRISRYLPFVRPCLPLLAQGAGMTVLLCVLVWIYRDWRDQTQALAEARARHGAILGEWTRRREAPPEDKIDREAFVQRFAVGERGHASRLADWNRWAEEVRVTLLSLTVRPDSPADGDEAAASPTAWRVQRQTVEIDLEGEFAETLAFLYRLETAEIPLLVDELQFTKSRRGIRAQLTLSLRWVSRD